MASAMFMAGPTPFEQENWKAEAPTVRGLHHAFGPTLTRLKRSANTPPAQQ